MDPVSFYTYRPQERYNNAHDPGHSDRTGTPLWGGRMNPVGRPRHQIVVGLTNEPMLAATQLNSTQLNSTQLT